MLLKGLVITALVASTPIAFVATQDPKPAPTRSEAAAAARAAATAVQEQEQKAAQARQDLEGMRRELDAAPGEMQTMRQQLDQALDALDRTFEAQRDRNCSPSRSRALMSHYQWLRDQGHAQRAATVVAKVVEQVGDEPHRLNSAAWHLMTDEETAGKFDEVALALAARMETRGEDLDPRHLDTIAMARFLAGQVDRAVELQSQAIARGGNGDEFRRRLRTYQAAKAAVAKASVQPQPATSPVVVPTTMVAAAKE